VTISTKEAVMRIPSPKETDLWSSVLAIALIGLVKALAWLIGV
jgi:hypothetical protein